LSRAKHRGWERLLGATGAELYVPRLNFVFGDEPSHGEFFGFASMLSNSVTPEPNVSRRCRVSGARHLAHCRRKIIMNRATMLRGCSITRAGSNVHRRIALTAALSTAGCTEWLTRQASTAPD